jgi:hypothetical protein
MVQLEAVGPLTNKVLNISEGYVDWQREGSTGISALPFSEALLSLDPSIPNRAIPQKGIKRSCLPRQRMKPANFGMLLMS